jgi:outer membrane protein TolC
MAEAQAGAESARLRVIAAAWRVRKEVVDAALDLYAARRTGALMDEETKLREDELAKLKVQVEAGEASPFEMNQTRLSLNRARLARQDSETRAVTARARLAAAIGIPASALDAVKIDFSPFRSLPPAPGASARRRALTHRADLLAALAEYAGADAALRLEIARQYPNITLSPGYELDQTDNKWSLGFSVELPVLNQNRGPIAEPQARRKRLGKAFAAQQEAVFGEIEIARAAYQSARRKVEIASRLAADAQQACTTTKAMVDAGELVPLELTRRKIEATAADLALAEARIEARKAANDLESAIQAPLRSKP